MARGNVDIEIDIEGIERALDELEKEVDNAVADEISSIASDGLTVAKDHIRLHDRVWNRNLLHNWVPLVPKTRFGQHLVGFRNFSEYAAAVDEGATYTDKKPNFDNIRRYVESEYPLTVAMGEQAIDAHAHALMNYIYENGLRGIDYTGEAERYMNDVGGRRIIRAIERNAGD